MAIARKKFSDTISVIARIDDALERNETFESAYSLYIDTLDENVLSLLPGKLPTRFIMKRHLDYNAAKALRTDQAGVGVNGMPELRLGFMLEDVRLSLVGIENPADLPADEHIKFEKGRDGYASKELIAYLNNIGVVNDLFAARNNSTNQTTELQKKS